MIKAHTLKTFNPPRDPVDISNMDRKQLIEYIFWLQCKIEKLEKELDK